MPSPAPKITRAVEDCLERCQSTTRPYTNVTRFIQELKATGKWSDAEIVDVQTRVIRVLLKQREERDHRD